MLQSFSEADTIQNEPVVQPKFSEDMKEEDEFENTEEVRKMFKEYISALTHPSDKVISKEDKIEELSDELDQTRYDAKDSLESNYRHDWGGCLDDGVSVDCKL